MIARKLFFATAALALTACVSTSIRDSWLDPQHRGPAYRKVLVLGVSSELTDRRVFEDVMVERIAATGATAAQSYRYLPEGGKVPEAELDGAVRVSGAEALLMSRVRNVDRRTSVSTAMLPAMPIGAGWYRLYSGWYPVTEVRQYDVAVVETTLFDAASKDVVWTGVTETFAPRSVNQDAPGFADVIVKELSARGLLSATK
jgi:hypothetical protein